MATLQEVIDQIRAANVGSQQLDNSISDFLGVARGKDFTRNLATIQALLPVDIVIQFNGNDNNGEQMVTIGKSPEFAGHYHGYHPANAQLSAVIGVLKAIKVSP